MKKHTPAIDWTIYRSPTMRPNNAGLIAALKGAGITEMDEPTRSTWAFIGTMAHFTAAICIFDEEPAVRACVITALDASGIMRAKALDENGNFAAPNFNQSSLERLVGSMLFHARDKSQLDEFVKWAEQHDVATNPVSDALMEFLKSRKPETVVEDMPETDKTVAEEAAETLRNGRPGRSAEDEVQGVRPDDDFSDVMAYMLSGRPGLFDGLGRKPSPFPSMTGRWSARRVGMPPELGMGYQGGPGPLSAMLRAVLESLKAKRDEDADENAMRDVADMRDAAEQVRTKAKNEADQRELLAALDALPLHFRKAAESLKGSTLTIADPAVKMQQVITKQRNEIRKLEEQIENGDQILAATREDLAGSIRKAEVQREMLDSVKAERVQNVPKELRVAQRTIERLEGRIRGKELHEGLDATQRRKAEIEIGDLKREISRLEEDLRVRNDGYSTLRDAAHDLRERLDEAEKDLIEAKELLADQSLGDRWMLRDARQTGDTTAIAHMLISGLGDEVAKRLVLELAGNLAKTTKRDPKTGGMFK